MRQLTKQHKNLTLAQRGKRIIAYIDGMVACEYVFTNSRANWQAFTEKVTEVLNWYEDLWEYQKLILKFLNDEESDFELYEAMDNDAINKRVIVYDTVYEYARQWFEANYPPKPYGMKDDVYERVMGQMWECFDAVEFLRMRNLHYDERNNWHADMTGGMRVLVYNGNK